MAGELPSTLLAFAPIAPALAAGAVAIAGARGLMEARARVVAGGAAAASALVVAWATLPALRGVARVAWGYGVGRAGWVDLRFALVADRWSALVSVTAMIIATAACALAAPGPRGRAVAVGSLLGGAATVLGALADGAPLTLMALELAGAATLVAGAGAPAWAFGARRLAALSLLALAAVVALPAGALGGGLHVQRAPASRGEIEVTDPSDARVEIETADRREARPAPLSGPIAAPARVTVAAAPASTSFAVGAGERVTVSPLGASTTYRVLAAQRALGEERNVRPGIGWWLVVVAALSGLAAAAALDDGERGAGARAARAGLAALGGPLLAVSMAERLASAGALSGRAPLVLVAACAGAAAIAARGGPAPSAGLARAALFAVARGARDLDERVIDAAIGAAGSLLRVGSGAAAIADAALFERPFDRAEAALTRLREGRPRGGGAAP